MLDRSLLTGALPVVIVLAGAGGPVDPVAGRRGDVRRATRPPI
ncbi:hypothetical protein [Pseudonocardia acidicola]|nr:hypothetical protein [Pseudonocardia acidicola]